MKERNWATKIYAHPRKPERVNNPYVTRISVESQAFSIEWIDLRSDGTHSFYYKPRTAEGEYIRIPLTEHTLNIDGVENGTDYAFYVERDSDGARSHVRYVNCCETIGTVINYNHPEDEIFKETGDGFYLGSPHLLRLPSGRLLISHDYHNGPNKEGHTVLFKSDDNGATWQHLIEFYPLFWPKLFYNQNSLYILGPAGIKGNLVIAKSDDEGESWTEPVTLVYGDQCDTAGIHQTATPVITHDGRIYTAIEMGRWQVASNEAFGHMLLSAPVDSDLLSKDSWDHTPMAFFDPALSNISDYTFCTAIEGNAVVGPDGEIYDVLRIDPVNCDRSKPMNRAILTRLRNFDAPLEHIAVIEPPVGLRHKFYIQRDEQTGLYFLIGNESRENNLKRRSIFTLAVSKDLFEWRRIATLLDCTALEGHSVSYPSFIIDGDDILYVSRTAYGKFHNFHDNNMVTFHRLENFRALL